MLGNKYVVGVVGLLLLMVIIYNAQYFMSKKKTLSASGNIQPAQKSSGTHKQPEKPGPVPVAQVSVKADKGSWKRDPFSLPPAVTVSKTEEIPEKIRLTGIINRDGNSMALINGNIYGVNDRIGRSVITEIKRHSIVILSDGKNQEVAFDDYKVVKEKKK